MISEETIVEDAREHLFDALVDAAVTELDGIILGEEGNNWMLSADALRFIAALVARLKPRHVVEFGSGRSTMVLAAACAGLPHPCAISSIDHDPEFGAAALPAAIERAGAACTVALQIAPLVTREMAGRFVPVYYLASGSLASDNPVDLVIVDGPPEALGGRAGTLFQAMELVRPGSIILFDDAMRHSEQRGFAFWRDVFDDAIEIVTLPGFRKGMVAVIVHRPVRAGDIWSYRNRDIWSDLESVVPSDSSCILVDDNQLHPAAFCDRMMLPFLERDGQYWGAPGSDADAIRELTRMRNEGAGFLALVRPAFWWLDYYTEFLGHLQTTYPRVLSNERAVVFDLRETFESSTHARVIFGE